MCGWRQRPSARCVLLPQLLAPFKNQQTASAVSRQLACPWKVTGPGRVRGTDLCQFMTSVAPETPNRSVGLQPMGELMLGLLVLRYLALVDALESLRDEAKGFS